MKATKIIFLNLITFLLIICFGECSVRLLKNNISLQTTDSTIFEEQKYAESTGLKANISGQVFGKTIQTDDKGELQLPCKSEKENSKKVVFIGDSVTSGVGVDQNNSFSALIACAEEDRLSLRNISLIGYNADDYQNIVNYLIESKATIDQLIIFICLNDIQQRGASIDYQNRNSFVKQILDLFKGNSYLYVWLKGIIADRQKSNFLFDYKLYQDEKLTDYMVNTFYSIQDSCQKNNIELHFVILPYEYQLRDTSKVYSQPQRILEQVLNKRGALVHNPASFFQKQLKDSKSAYLFGDGLHFSEEGHLLVKEFLINEQIIQ